jgi:NADPH:quinone reductase-like Zn-dependent oxidoreductase
MKSLHFQQPGRPTDVLQLTDLPTPEPSPGQVRIRVQAAPINPSDLMFVQNRYGIRPQLPSGAGFEGMGTVDAAGDGVTLPVGQRVSFTGVGSWAESIVVPVQATLPVPDEMSDDVAAQLFVNPVTAYAMIRESGVKPGGWLMLTAAGSAFGKLVIQFCKRAGIRTIGTVRRPDLIDELKALGADEIIDVSRESVTERVKQLTEGKGVPCLLEAIAGRAAAEVLPCLSRGGTMLIYGALSLDEVPVNAGLLIFKSLTLRGFWLSTWLPAAPTEVRHEVFSTVTQLLTRGDVQVPVEAQYPLDRFADALRHAEAEGRTGKILFTMA